MYTIVALWIKSVKTDKNTEINFFGVCFYFFGGFYLFLYTIVYTKNIEIAKISQLKYYKITICIQ
ncbi:MAG: hypothetical protein A2469_00150 [Candidatus Magasanikbacteria bacterium RIFOXYC2_FULL_40_16]|uniref:Uncharacterized protein n=1 Tax=Candidatus Magasanikbacteria bacterium RIFOXYC2_FULL_40_16 TaxID=1798703 RepID=A0A1F6P263_9BACT|nr:MAG: hypothetical protein A2469_00150 [Candidatus Magasanikbacteria bacterium RIFOXYC2_FULL_40_16]